jgi:hypothetical protein
MVDGDELLVTNISDGVVDDVQRTTVTSNPWSSTTGTSLGDGEGWPETTAASVVVGGLEELREKAGQAINRCYRERGKGGGARGEKGCFTASESMVTGGGNCEFRREIPAAWRLRIERGREEKGEGVLGFIGTVLMAS